MKEKWLLDPNVVYLNHGAYGATPRAVLAAQDEVRALMERDPARFLSRDLEPLLDDARRALAEFLGCDPQGLAFVQNATAGVNTVLRSLDLDEHDEILVTNQEYNATRNVLDFVAGMAGARVVVVDLPFPVASNEPILERLLAAITNQTRLLVIDHISSQTGLVLPVERLVSEMRIRGIDTLIDGAHAPGTLPLDLQEIGAAYYTGNLHKWVCAPKGAAFLYVRENRRYAIRPMGISHGANSTRTERSRFLIEFDWTGTFDPTAWLAVPTALQFLPSLVEGGWPEVLRRNHALAIQARDILCAALDVDAPTPDSMVGSMATVPLPDGDPNTPISALWGDPLQEVLFRRYNIEVPVMVWPQPPKRLLRISAQLYNRIEEYQLLTESLRQLL